MPVWFSSLLLAHTPTVHVIQGRPRLTARLLGREGANTVGSQPRPQGRPGPFQGSQGFLLTTENRTTSTLTSEARRRL